MPPAMLLQWEAFEIGQIVVERVSVPVMEAMTLGYGADMKLPQVTVERDRRLLAVGVPPEVDAKLPTVRLRIAMVPSPSPHDCFSSDITVHVRIVSEGDSESSSTHPRFSVQIR